MIAGPVAAPHAGVADERHVGAKLGGVLPRGRAPDCCCPIPPRPRAGWRRLTGRPPLGLPRARRLDEGHQLALVVGGAARDDPLAAVGHASRAAARRAASSRGRADRPAGRRSDRRRGRGGRSPLRSWPTTIGCPGVARSRRVEADVRQVFDQPLRRLAAGPAHRQDRSRCFRSGAARTGARGSPAFLRRSAARPSQAPSCCSPVASIIRSRRG